MAEVTIGGNTLDVTGTPGTLTVSDGWLVNIPITSEAEVISLAETIAAEAAKAWPGLTIIVSQPHTPPAST